MPPITTISSVPPDFARPEPRDRARGRGRLGQALASEVIGQVQRALGSRGSQAQLTAAAQQQQVGTMTIQTRAAQQPTLQPPLDLVQRFFTERQAKLREAALQRDEILRQQDNDQLRPIAQAQREADRLQVLRDAQLLETQLLETQRLATQRITPAPDAEQLRAQRFDEQRSEDQRLGERTLQREEAARTEEQRLEEEREAERSAEEQEAERVEDKRLEEEREAERSEAARIEAEQETERPQGRQDTRIDTDRVLVERAALAYRSESERAVAEATSARFEAAQPLNEQLRVARERLDAMEARRIDRVDVSSASLSRLTF
jgi:hypothetical protein